MNRTTKILLLTGALGLALLTVWRVTEAVSRRSSAANETPAAAATPVDVVAAATRDLVETLTVAGTLRALHEAAIVADVPGRVEQVSVDVGDAVQKGAALARLEQGDLSLQLDQANAALAAAEAGRDTAVRDLAGAEAVAKVGGATETQLVAAKSRADAAEAQVKQARAAAGLARARLADATLRSPIDGVVTRRATGLGQMVTPGVPVFTVADLSSLELELAVDERAAARIHVGDAVDLTSEAAPGALQGGTVKTVSPALDPNTRKAAVVVSLPWQTGLLPHGTASARFALGRATGAVAVPIAALLEDQGVSFVYVVDGSVARRKDVNPGIRDAGLVEVRGLDAGAPVIVGGNNFVSDGTPVTVRAQEPS